MPSIPSADCLNIVMAASEAVPYAKTGGLADVVGALPLELVKLRHRVTLVLPGYRNFVAGRQFRQPAVRLRIPTMGISVEVTLEEEIVPVTAGLHPLRVLAVRYDPSFDRPGLYQDQRGDYPDNLVRFTLFCRAVLKAVRFLNLVRFTLFCRAVLKAVRFLAGVRREAVDILHLHDWQTALCAVYLKTLAQERKGLGPLKTLLTLHNVGYQGVFPGAQFSKTGLPPALYSTSGLELVPPMRRKS
jgi:starch synthase